ncbi:MAG: hypothetical protein HS119_12725 [Flavobacteriales bacterium]|nr:hypothetical protein [Flavobacteriales bacterium]
MEEEKELKKGQKAYLKRIVNEFQEDANKALTSIENLKAELVKGKEGSPSLIEQFKKTEIELAEIKNNIIAINSAIFEEDENGNILSDEIEEFKELFEKRKNEIIAVQNEIIAYQNKIFGIKRDDGTETKGIQHSVEGFVKKLDSLYSENTSRQEQLFEKIEGLLKGASTVALAKAFNDHKESFKWTNVLWVAVFIASVVAMMALSIVAFINSEYNLSEMWKYTLGNLPFLGGAIWLAIYASKQRSQNVRLQQEYAFKEDVAKIYYGLKQEIEELGDSDLGQKLNEQILSIIVETVSYNPSDTLESKAHQEKSPILEAINNVSQLVKDLKGGNPQG